METKTIEIHFESELEPRATSTSCPIMSMKSCFQKKMELHFFEWLKQTDPKNLYNLYIYTIYTCLDLPRGAEWMIRGACTPSLRVQTAPFGRCWCTTCDTVDGRNPANQLRLVVCPILYRVLCMLGGCWDFFHQQYLYKLCHVIYSHNHHWILTSISPDKTRSVYRYVSTFALFLPFII